MDANPQHLSTVEIEMEMERNLYRIRRAHDEAARLQKRQKELIRELQVRPDRTLQP